ncbi:GNAT family N-acetyltransferase [Streptomyces xiamenensis]|uniref:GNAT family N-acetyltransferase n=1 Tax=Streptomyces xiamenensis TaxID=408015 RepID=UPI0036B7EA8B
METRWVRLELDVTGFEAERFAPYVERCLGAGIRLVTLDELGDTARNRQALYALNKECAADIPERGEFYTYDAYVRQRIEIPSYAPRGVVIALDGDGGWIGMSATSDHRSSGFVFNELTGVRAAFRGRGISLAMKTFGIGFAARCGVDRIRTVHHPANTAAIEMNRRLGYVDAPERDG